MTVPAPPVVTSAEQRGSSVSCASQSRTCTFGAWAEIDAGTAAAGGQDRLVGRAGQAARRRTQQEGILVVRGALGHVHPGPVGRRCVQPLRCARRVGRVPEQRADVAHAGRQVVAVEVELGDARHDVERQPAQDLVDRASQGAQPVVRAQLVDPPAPWASEQLADRPGDTRPRARATCTRDTDA